MPENAEKEPGRKLITETYDRVSVSANVSPAIADRLTKLVNMASDANASRYEVLSLLIASCDLSTEELESGIMDLRKASEDDLPLRSSENQ